MNIDSIKNGIVIDHITAGKGMTVYNILGLNNLDCSIAIIQNATSRKMGKKDIIKIDSNINMNMDALGYVDPGVTVNIIVNCQRVEKRKTSLPMQITNVIFCKNPRCITATEQELPHVFNLTDVEARTYRCKYCETKP